MSRANYAIKAAYERGYRVSEEGILMDPNGNVVSLPLLDPYPTFLPALPDPLLSTTPVPVRRFAAYCFFGDELFVKDIQVHCRDPKAGHSKANLYLKVNPWVNPPKPWSKKR